MPAKLPRSIPHSKQDYPGEYGINRPEKQEEVKNFLRESAAIVIPIDAAALMEQGGKYHETFNQPIQLTDWFKEVFQDWETPRLVIFAPVKCEKYIKEQRKDELFDGVECGYKKLLKKLSSDDLLGKVAVAIAPVETVGNVFFSRLEETEQKETRWYYRKYDANDRYEPKNSEQPLKYILKFICEVYLSKKPPLFSRAFDSLFGGRTSLNNAVRKFADPDLKVTKIVQGKELLNIET